MSSSPHCFIKRSRGYHPAARNWSAPIVTLLLWLSLAALAAGELHAADVHRPNIVVILADDLGWDDVSWNNPRVQTPNLARLCAEGVRLDQQYVTPMCSPTRATLLSGRYASRFGVTSAQNERAFPFNTVTLPRALKSVGYETALIGKWHLGSAPEWGPQKFGFDYSYGTLAGGCGPYSHKYKAGPYENSWHRNGKLITEEGHVTDLITQDAVKWLGERDDKPFFLYLAFTAPHVPIAEPEEWQQVYSEREKWLQRYPKGDFPAKRQYYADVTHLDSAVGKVMDALDKSGKRGDTLVVFLSDNGATPYAPNDGWLKSTDPREQFTPGPGGGSNRPLRGEKTEVFEGGIRVPAFVNWPGVLKPGAYADPIHAADWMPTLCAMAGYTPNHDLKWDGSNAWPWITGKQTEPARQLYWVDPGFVRFAVRDGDYKLIYRKRSYHAQLFDLRLDPEETTDLAAQQPKRVAALMKLESKLSARDNDAKVKPNSSVRFTPDNDNFPDAAYARFALAREHSETGR